jgi:hypothetical protein
LKVVNPEVRRIYESDGINPTKNLGVVNPDVLRKSESEEEERERRRKRTKKKENEEERERRRESMKRKRMKRKRMKRSPIPRSFNNKGTVEGNALLIRTAHQTEGERASCLAASVLTNALAPVTISDNGDLTTYKEAKESALRKQWIEATKDEWMSLPENKTFEFELHLGDNRQSTLEGFTDSHWARSKDKRKSMAGYTTLPTLEVEFIACSEATKPEFYDGKQSI